MNGELDIRMDKKELWALRILTVVIVIISIVDDKPEPQAGSHARRMQHGR